MSLVRVSLANLVYGVVVDGDVVKGPFGIISPKSFASDKPRVQALGGGAELTSAGVDFLRRIYGADHFEVDKGTGATDARFVLPEIYIDAIFGMFEEPDPSHVEVDPTREIFDELQKTYPCGSILTHGDLAGASVHFRDYVRQPIPEGGVGTSLREKADMPTRRMFRRFDLHLSYDAFRLMREHPAVVFLTPDDLGSTNGGRRKGVTSTGLEMADNLIL